MDKYEDMAYTNARGIAWISTLTRPDIWARWLNKIKRATRDIKVIGTTEEYARRILIEAIWHRGYSKNLTNPRAMARCARRLRQPRDRGEGVDPVGCNMTMDDLGAFGMPWEFVLLDEFLEQVVRPLM